MERESTSCTNDTNPLENINCTREQYVNVLVVTDGK